MNGKVAKYEIHSANLHDFTVGCIMNRDWPAYGGPKQMGDKRPSVLTGAVLLKKGYQSGTYLTPPKNNAKQIDPRWKAEYAAARKVTESTFSALAGSGLR
ncbi:hypothetical protein ACVWZX_003951 [Deinococcus sp. UYEF24]